ncbi:MAG: hypothetical protein VYA55_18885 [Pseudomonadota bacterium]|nr:hypothetical protein [Pseudomonadota bacterium]
MEVKADSAGRLHDLLEVAAKQNDGKSAREVFGLIFNVDCNDNESILRLLADVINLSYQTKNRIRALDDVDHALYLRPFGNIEKVLSAVNLDASWKAYKPLLDETTLYGLKFCSDKLSRIENVSSIENSVLEEIQNELNTLVEKILKSNLNQELKSLLISNLEELRQAIVAFRVRGIEGIERGVEICLGSIVVNKDKIKSQADDKDVGWSIKSYFAILDVVNKTVSAAKGVKELGVHNIANNLLGNG